MYELNYELKDIDTKQFYGVQNQYFNLIKSSFPTLKITGRDNFIFAMGNNEALKVLQEKLADNSDFPEDLFVVHTEYPRFILNVEEEEVEWLDDLEGDDEEQVAEEATKVVEEAFKWCDAELEKYDDEDEA